MSTSACPVYGGVPSKSFTFLLPAQKVGQIPILVEASATWQVWLCKLWNI